MSRAADRRYVALGDSYTIGTSVTQAERWPDLLVGRLAATATPLRLIANLGVNGFTSRDVIDVELPRLPGLAPVWVDSIAPSWNAFSAPRAWGSRSGGDSRGRG